MESSTADFAGKVEQLDRQIFEMRVKARAAIACGMFAIALAGAFLGYLDWKEIPKTVESEVQNQVSNRISEKMQTTLQQLDQAVVGAQAALTQAEGAETTAKAAADAVSSNSGKLLSLAHNGTRVGIVWMGQTPKNGMWPNHNGYTQFVPFIPPFEKPPLVVTDIQYVPYNAKGNPRTYVSQVWRDGCLVVFSTDDSSIKLPDKLSAYFIAGPADVSTNSLQ